MSFSHYCSVPIFPSCFFFLCRYRLYATLADCLLYIINKNLFHLCLSTVGSCFNLITVDLELSKLLYYPDMVIFVVREGSAQPSNLAHETPH